MKNLSKFMSLVLRHRPESIGISLDPNGWTTVDSLIAGINNDKINITRDDIDEIVAADNKGRYSFSDDLTMIRANQGHSVKVDLQLKVKVAPVMLYHGTPERFTEIINKGTEKNLFNIDNLNMVLTLKRKVKKKEDISEEEKNTVLGILNKLMQ